MKRVSIVSILFLIIILGLFIKNNSLPKVSQDKLESFLSSNNASTGIREAYKFAQENPQGVLSRVKCYCGCLKNNGHKNNRDCFFNEDGSYDLMGLNCGLCVKTALISKQMLNEGKSVEDIAAYVDTRWGQNN